MARQHTIQDCIQALSARCDGAKARDGVGFNAVHTKLGKYLAQLPEWDDATVYFVWKEVLPVYQQQLLNYGIDISTIPAPPKVADIPKSVSALNTKLYEQNKRQQSLQSRKMTLRETGYVPFFKKRAIVLNFDYDWELIQQIKLVFTAAKFDRNTRSWLIPLDQKEAALAFADEHGFQVEQAVRDAKAGKAQPKVRSHRIEIEDDLIRVFFPFNREILEDIKEIPGRRFNSDDPSRKHWTIPMREPCLVALQGIFMVHKEFEPDWDRLSVLVDRYEGAAERAEEMSRAVDNALVTQDAKESFQQLGGTLRPFQEIGVCFAQEHKRVLIADDMGCIDGEASVHVNRAGKGFSITLAELFYKFHGGKSGQGKRWDADIPTMIRSLCGNELRLNKIENVLDKGVRKVLKITLSSGKIIRLTPDHEVCTGVNWFLHTPEPSFLRADRLILGDEVITNGIPICAECGSTVGVATYKYAKFRGYCKTCIYRKKRRNYEGQSKDTIRKGYRYIQRGLRYHPNWNASGIEEHRLVAEAMLNGMSYEYWLHLCKMDRLPEHALFISRDQHVHHINGDKLDNRPENLEILSASDHHKVHDKHLNFPLFHWQQENVIAIEEDGEAHVYDVVCADPHRNFVANGVVVHNCGKTIEAAAFIGTTPGIKKAVVVVPSSVKFNWCKELRYWVPGMSVSVLHNRKKPVPVVLPDYRIELIPTNDFSADIIVLNYDILVRNLDALKQCGFDASIWDESHALKNHKAKRTKAAVELTADMENIVLLTGTPILNRPHELISQLQILRRLNDLGGFWHFANYYCGAQHTRWGMNLSGAQNLAELHEQLRRQGIFIRRTKEQVLTELPQKQRTTLPFQLTPKDRKAYTKAASDFVSWLLENGDQDKQFLESIAGLPEDEQKEKRQERRIGKAMKARQAEHLVRIGTLKKLAVRAKMATLKTWIGEFLESGEKLILFGYHNDEINEIADEFGALKIVGSTPAVERQAAVDAFQSDPDVNLIVGNIQAMGVGITLTAASNVAFFELGWNPSVHDQAEDRAYRMGQHNAVNCWYLLAEGTIEMEIARLIESKRSVIDAVVDGVGDGPGAGMIGDLTKYLLAQAAAKNKRIAKWQAEMEEALFYN